jgi:hypothetical protein
MKLMGQTGDQNRNNSKDDQHILYTGQLYGKYNIFIELTAKKKTI